MTVLTETRERFLSTIAAQVPADRIAEIHFFSPIKQGGVESGVAVVAAEATGDARGAMGDENGESDVAAEDRESPIENRPSLIAHRLVIYTALYRLTLKGADRGKWETLITAEADAPLVTVDAVVRGVQRRSGDVDDPARMEGDEIRAILEAKAAAVPGTRPAAS